MPMGPAGSEPNYRGKVPLILSRYLDTDGDGGGTKDAIGDYSGGEERRYFIFSLPQLLFIEYRVY